MVDGRLVNPTSLIDLSGTGLLSKRSAHACTILEAIHGHDDRIDDLYPRYSSQWYDGPAFRIVTTATGMLVGRTTSTILDSNRTLACHGGICRKGPLELDPVVGLG